MGNGEVGRTDRAVLAALLDMDQQGVAQTVHAAAQRAGADYSVVYATVNRLFTAGLITSGLHVTDAGQAALRG